MVAPATQVATPCTTTSHSLPTVAVIQVPAVTVLQTGFDREETKRKENIIWTERERAKAEAGEVIQDLGELHSKVRGAMWWQTLR